MDLHEDPYNLFVGLDKWRMIWYNKGRMRYTSDMMDSQYKS